MHGLPRLCVAIVALLPVLSGTPSWADDPSIADLKAEVERLRIQVARLLAENVKLRAGQSPAAASATNAPATYGEVRVPQTRPSSVSSVRLRDVLAKIEKTARPYKQQPTSLLKNDVYERTVNIAAAILTAPTTIVLVGALKDVGQEKDDAVSITLADLDDYKFNDEKTQAIQLQHYARLKVRIPGDIARRLPVGQKLAITGEPTFVKSQYSTFTDPKDVCPIVTICLGGHAVGTLSLKACKVHVGTQSFDATSGY